jgi:hypothetical protein
VRRASFRSLEHRSRSVQSGPVGQGEYTNAAKAADGANCATTPASCVATSLESNRPHRQAGGPSFSLSGRTVPQGTRLLGAVASRPARRGSVPSIALARARLLRQNGCKCSAASSRLAPSGGCRLTLPSRGCPKGCAFCAPLMSNVRPQKLPWPPAHPCCPDTSLAKL